MPQQIIELRHRWGQYPLWDVRAAADVDPATLPIPPSLMGRLNGWAARWDSTFDLSQPDRSRVERFVIDELGHEGARLWRALLGLLPPSRYVVTYHHEDETFVTPEDLPIEWRFG